MFQRIEDGSERFLVDEKSLAHIMKMIYKNSELRERCSRNCISFARNFTWDKQIEKWDKYLREYLS
jgi:glycosyltransferase involved in cell wall biosynthesis